MSSLANDIFEQLTRGIRFNKDHNIVANDVKTNSYANVSKSRNVPDSASQKKQELSNQLDFFGERSRRKESDDQVTAEFGKGCDAVKQHSGVSSTMTKTHVKRSMKQSDAVAKKEPDDELMSMKRVDEFRRRVRISVKGSDVSAPMENFSASSLLSSSMQRRSASKRSRYARKADILLRNIEGSAYTEPTSIQMQAIPLLLNDRDVIGVAPTGSGKTAAFLIPLIMKVCGKERKLKKSVSGVSHGSVQSLIVSPTRELAQQIFREFEKLAKGIVFRACVLRKMTEGNILASLSGKDDSKGFHLIVATPKRLVNLIQSDQIKLSSVELLVFDEADKLFEMGFLHQIDEIIGACGSKCQKALFSATMPQQISDLARSVLKDPVEVTIGTRNAGADTIDQKLLFVGQEQGKIIALKQLIASGELVPPTLLFVQSKERCKELYSELVYEGIRIDLMHSERTQAQREQSIEKFRRGEVWFLLCTDLMGRGIDFKGVNCVVNYDFPDSAISYIHRIGRTGRAERQGKAFTFFTLQDVDNLRSIANVVRLNGCDVPGWMLELRRNRHKSKSEKQPVKRARISTVSHYDKSRARKRRVKSRQSKTETHTINQPVE